MPKKMLSKPKVKFTKSTVDAIKPTDRDEIYWDTKTPAMFLKVTPKGRKVFGIYYRSASGAQRRPMLGRYGNITVDGARKAALAMLESVAAGGDPSKERRDARGAPDLNAVFDRFIKEYATGRKKPRSIDEDERNYRKHVKPTLGTKRVAEIEFDDIERLHRKLGGSRGNRVIALLSKVFNLCEKWKLRPLNSNPCRHVERFPEQSRERYLSPAELGRLGKVLAAAELLKTETAEAIAAIRLLLFTGCRKNEILTLRWADVDLDAGVLRLPDSKTGRKTVQLPAPAREVLSAITPDDTCANPDDWVLPGSKDGGHLINLQKPWDRISAAAELDDCRIHDLRHAFAAVGASGGMSLHLLGGLLGHAQSATTGRYAHLQNDPLKTAAEKIAAEIAAGLKGASAEIVPLKKSS